MDQLARQAQETRANLILRSIGDAVHFAKLGNEEQFAFHANTALMLAGDDMALLHDVEIGVLCASVLFGNAR